MCSLLLRSLSLILLSVAVSLGARGQDVEPQRIEQEHAEPKSLKIKNLKLFVWQKDGKGRKYVEVQALQETREQHLTPSNKFDVSCDIVGGLDVLTGDYLLWTTVDFLIAPVTRAYEQMDNGTLGSSVAWGPMTEMRDLKAAPIYFLKPDELRNVAVNGLDLSPVIAAFPVGEDGELWPWLVRVTVHVQDRSGKQVTSAERTLRLSPSSARKKSHYNEPLLSR